MKNLHRIIYHKIIGNRQELWLLFTTAIRDFFTVTLRNFFAKNDIGIKYPYTVHDPYFIFGKVSKYDKTYLVGDSWLNQLNPKPIALMLGFNDWKYGFVSAYLPDYRTAFTIRKLGVLGHLGLILLLLSAEKPSAVFVWGYTDNFFIRILFKLAKLSITRVEDGFVRSSALGASHSTPYSLVFDKTGLYYDCSKPSDVEGILNNYEFQNNPELLISASEELNNIIEYQVSKYNPAVIKSSKVIDSIKLKKRVVVIGQVDNDSSIRLGNPDDWTIESLIELAWLENSDADILYRPHPEVYKGYQRSNLKRREVEKFATIASPDEPIIDFIETADHVYTITSLTGLEALLRGIKVTVVGLPFYAGWGLTDDRVKAERRQTKRTLIELFAGIYLLYPKYLADLNNSALGLHAACMRIQADYVYDMHAIYESIPHDAEADIKTKISSKYWPQLLFNKTSTQNDELIYKNLANINFARILENKPGRLFQTCLLYGVSGAIKSEHARDQFLTAVRKYIDFDLLSIFLNDLIAYHPGLYITKHLTWLLVEAKEFELSAQVMMLELEKLMADKVAVEKTTVVLTDGSVEESVKLNQKIENRHIDKEQARHLLDFLVTHKNNNDFDSAIDIGKTLLISGNASSMLFIRIAEIAELKFDSASARQIADIQQRIGLNLHNRGGLNIDIENTSTNFSDHAKTQLVEKLYLQLKTNPDRINRSWGMFKSFLIDRRYYKTLRASLNLDNEISFQKALAYLEIDEPLRAKAVLERMALEGDFSDKESIAYSKTLFSLGEHDKALFIIKKAIDKRATHENYTEYMRLLKSLGRFDEALSVLNDGVVKKLDLSPLAHAMPIYFGLQKIEEGFKGYLDSEIKEKLISFFGSEKYKQTDTLDVESLLLISAFGPAEEIRFAGIYKELANAMGVKNFKITCDYRLLSLMQRSFPDIVFVPVKRTRYFSPQYPREDFNELPSSELIEQLDNVGLKAVNEAKEIALLSEFLWQFRKSYADFANKKPYLISDKAKAEKFHQQLPKNTKLIGLCWRSSLTNSMRNVHYLTIEQLEPIFQIEGVTYVNFQYEDYEDELAWVEKRYPGKLINMDEIDYYNDFDSVAALMGCMDLIIAPLTAVIELAGALGRPSLVFSNHGEAWWREIDSQGTDVWFNNVKQVRTTVGDKTSLVKAIASKIEMLKA
jgi:capsular polysaccharide export protein